MWHFEMLHSVQHDMAFIVLRRGAEGAPDVPVHSGAHCVGRIQQPHDLERFWEKGGKQPWPIVAHSD